MVVVQLLLWAPDPREHNVYKFMVRFSISVFDRIHHSCLVDMSDWIVGWGSFKEAGYARRCKSFFCRICLSSHVMYIYVCTHIDVPFL